jgi:hypothetical protein
MAEAVGGIDGGPGDAARFLGAMFAGMGDDCSVAADGRRARVEQHGLRLAHGLDDDARADLLRCWIALWTGAVHSHRQFIDVAVTPAGDGVIWELAAR